MHFPDELKAQFEPFQLLGRGGMGEVWHAQQRALSRDVALKLLLPWANLELGIEPVVASPSAAAAYRVVLMQRSAPSPSLLATANLDLRGLILFLDRLPAVPWSDVATALGEVARGR